MILNTVVELYWFDLSVRYEYTPEEIADHDYPGSGETISIREIRLEGYPIHVEPVYMEMIESLIWAERDRMTA